VHSSPIQNENVLYQRISAASDNICSRLGKFENVKMMFPSVHWSWGYFKHLLWNLFW